MTGNIIEKKNIKYLVVHCSDTNDDENIGSLEIHKMHSNLVGMVLIS